ncbi:hypothetical protein SZ54_0859 [Rhizobium sp. UR51a]|nr:hypothetical protein SZ54_0859 [Rhizobium sp. UR51a]
MPRRTNCAHACGAVHLRRWHEALRRTRHHDRGNHQQRHKTTRKGNIRHTRTCTFSGRYPRQYRSNFKEMR